MVYSELLTLLVGLLGGLALWFMKRTIDSQDERLKRLELSQVEIKTDYVHKTEFKDFKLELREMFNELRQDIRELKK